MPVGIVEAIGHVHVAAPASAVAACREFYGDVLGLSEAPKPAALRGRGGAWFHGGNAALHVGVEPDPDNAESRRHVAFRVADLDAARRRVEAFGAPVEDAVPVPGVARFYTRDPAGNRVELYAASDPPPAYQD